MKKWTPKKIRNLRNKLEASQASFAERIGVTRNYVYYLERGERIPSKTMMLLLDYIENELSEKDTQKGEKQNAKRII